MKQFKSPQTGSVYTVFAKIGDDLICYRELEDYAFRVRIQSDNKSRLECIAKHAKLKSEYWSDIKGDDHVSVVVAKDRLIEALGDAVKAVSYCNDFPPVIQ